MKAHAQNTILNLLMMGLFAAFFLTASDSYAAKSASGSGGIFYVPINRSELITTNADMAEVVVTDPAVANVLVHGKHKVSVIGVQIGQTTLRIFDADHKLLRNVDVYVTYDLPAVRKALKQFLPNENIGVSVVNTRMALTGDVSSAASASQAMEIAQEFVYGKLQEGGNETRNTYDGDGKVSPVLNMMKVSTGQQVMLRIRIGEVQRSAVKNLGISLQSQGTSDFPFVVGTGNGQAAGLDAVTGKSIFQYGAFNLADSASAFGFFRTPARIGYANIEGLLEALERDGLAKTLAEPNLTALSGEEAQFLAGGEFPVVVPQSNGAYTIEYRPYGVALKFVPYVINPNRIRVQVNPEVSEINNDNSLVTGAGVVARAITTRRASTTVELAPGESFMIAGLITDSMNSTIDQIPGAGDIPILGALFRSTAFRRNETELVIAVTPYLVDPARSSDIKLPTDNFKPASFMDTVLFGALSGTTSGKKPSLEGPSGFMTDN